MPVDLPPNAHLYIPVLVEEICEHWPELPYPYYLGAQVEQETCISLKHKRCWSPKAELKTSREYGFGLGQLTITARFNNFKTALQLDPSLKDWKWEDRYEPSYQLRTMVLMNLKNFNSFPFASTDKDQFAFAMAAYNGGLGGTLNDIKLCRATKGCNPGQWFKNVEKTSLKSRTKWQGYGKSAFEINREYVINILRVRYPKYLDKLSEEICYVD